MTQPNLKNLPKFLRLLPVLGLLSLPAFSQVKPAKYLNVDAHKLAPGKSRNQAMSLEEKNFLPYFETMVADGSIRSWSIWPSFGRLGGSNDAAYFTVDELDSFNNLDPLVRGPKMTEMLKTWNGTAIMAEMGEVTTVGRQVTLRWEAGTETAAPFAPGQAAIYTYLKATPNPQTVEIFKARQLKLDQDLQRRGLIVASDLYSVMYPVAHIDYQFVHILRVKDWGALEPFHTLEGAFKLPGEVVDRQVLRIRNITKGK